MADEELVSRNKAYGSATSIRVYYDLETRRYIVSNIIGTAHRFPEGFSFSGAPGFESYGQNGVDGVRGLTILTPSDGNPTLALTYASFGAWQFDSSDRPATDTRIDDRHYFYFGIPTPAANVPRTGSARYSGIARGALFDPDAVLALDGTMTLDANFSTLAISTSLSLRSVNERTGASALLPALVGLGSISSASNFFRGELSTADNSFVGSWQGAFFGPAAEEVGYSFAINNAALDRIGGGVAVGRR